MTQIAYRAANKLFEHCYPAYFILYSAWKAIADRRERLFFRQTIKPDMVVVDIGANVGIYTRFFSTLLGTSGRVHAFEPAMANFTHLTETAGGRANVSLNHAAVGERSGTTTLYLSDEMNVDHRTFDSADGRPGVQVPLVALDDYFAVGARVDVIKIDVQGFEMSVLKGASRLLAENPQLAILVEFWPYGLKKAGTIPKDVIAYVKERGFSVAPVPGSDASVEDLLSGPSGIGEYCNVIVTRQKN